MNSCIIGIENIIHAHAYCDGVNSIADEQGTDEGCMQLPIFPTVDVLADEEELHCVVGNVEP